MPVRWNQAESLFVGIQGQGLAVCLHHRITPQPLIDHPLTALQRINHDNEHAGEMDSYSIGHNTQR